MNETHRTYCKNAALQLLAEIDAHPDTIDDPSIIHDPDILLDRIESYSYSPHPRLTIEHAFDRIILELIALRPELASALDY